MELKKLVSNNLRRIIGASLALSLLIAQTAGATSNVVDQVKSKGNIEYDSNSDGTPEVLFCAEDLKKIGEGYDFVYAKIAALDASYSSLVNTTGNYKRRLVSGLNKSVRQNNNLPTDASYNDIINAIDNITNQAARNYDLTPANTSTAIAEGYYNGKGKINVTSAPAPGTQAITSARILTGYSGWVNGSLIKGAMTDQADRSFALKPDSGTVTIPEGYYNGKGKITISSAPANGKTAVTSAAMLTGYSGWANGKQVDGSMPNNGNLNVTLNPGGSKTLTAGYYSGGTITAAKNTETVKIPWTGVVKNESSKSYTYDLGETSRVRTVDVYEAYLAGRQTVETPGNATADTILKNFTAWVNGVQLTGTMTNYSNSTGQASTPSNSSGTLYVSPSNAGYYTSSSSFNTGISYDPNKTVTSSASTSTATADGKKITANTIYLAAGKKAVLPAGYYSSEQTIQNVASTGMGGTVVTLHKGTQLFKSPEEGTAEPTTDGQLICTTTQDFNFVFASYSPHQTDVNVNYCSYNIYATGGTSVDENNDYYGPTAVRMWKNVPKGTKFYACDRDRHSNGGPLVGWMYGVY